MCSDWLPHRQRMHTRQTSPATAASEAPTECPCTTACYTQRPCARAVEYSPVLFYCVLIFSILLVYSEMTDPLQKVDEMETLNEMKERIRNMTKSYKIFYQSVFPNKCQTVCEDCDNTITQLEHWSIKDIDGMVDLQIALGILISKLQKEHAKEIIANDPQRGIWPPHGQAYASRKFLVGDV